MKFLRSIATWRVVTAFLCVLLALALANRLGRLRWFWPYDEIVLAGVFIAYLANLAFFTPAADVHLVSQRALPSEQDESRDA